MKKNKYMKKLLSFIFAFVFVALVPIQTLAVDSVNHQFDAFSLYSPWMTWENANTNSFARYTQYTNSSGEIVSDWSDEDPTIESDGAFLRMEYTRLTYSTSFRCKFILSNSGCFNGTELW